MAPQTPYLAILSLLLFNQVKSQTGAGCWLKTCDNPGQVRIDAKFNPTTGAFLGGCNCACPPAMADPASPSYCAPPKEVNFHAGTLVGDCSCNCPAGSNTACSAPLVYNVDICGCDCPSWGVDPLSCTGALEYLPATCSCGCEIGAIGSPCLMNGAEIRGSIVKEDCTCDTAMVQCPGHQVPNVEGACSCPEVINGLRLPSCDLPLVRDPLTCDCITTTTTTPPPGPVSVTCQDVGDCSCPHGTQGTCTITCDVGTDACKDGIIECNNDGYDCTVNCLSGSACAGSAKIIGPVGGSLNINCIGGQSCEGSVEMNGELGYDMNVDCQGSQACKGSCTMLFGSGRNTLKCTGPPDSCQGMYDWGFILPSNALSFSCTGSFCPPGAPANFDKSAQTVPQYPGYPQQPQVPQASQVPQYPAPGQTQAGVPAPQWGVPAWLGQQPQAPVP